MLKLNGKEIMLLVGFLFFFIVILGLFILSQSKKSSSPQNAEPTVAPVTSLRDSAYESLTPGKTTESDAIGVFGSPVKTETRSGVKYFIYKTRFDSIFDILAFKDNVLLYALENFSGDLKKTPNSFTNKYGGPDEVLYDSIDEVLEWRIFSSKGVAVAVAPFENNIIKIAYFKPVYIDEFNSFFLSELNLEKQKNSDPEEVIGP